MPQNNQNTPKGLTFQPCDEILVTHIIEYQENNGLPCWGITERERPPLSVRSLVKFPARGRSNSALP